MIAGAGFTCMAWALAKSREFPYDPYGGLRYPVSRERAFAYAFAYPALYPASRRYYRMLDKAWRQGQHVKYLGLTVFL